MKHGCTLPALLLTLRHTLLTPSRWSALFCLVTASMALLAPSAAAQSPLWNPTVPRPAIAQANNEVTVSWLLSPYDYALEMTTTLPPSGGWTGVSRARNFLGDEISITMPMTNGSQFFRLSGLAYVPIFSFAIFYAVDLEINPNPNMIISGPVHGNSNIFTAPANSLTFQSRVTAANQIYPTKSPLDPVVRTHGTVTYLGGHRSGVSPLTLPIGTNNTADNLREILNLPPDGEDPASNLAKQRYYNKADMIVVVSDSSVTVKSGLLDNFATTVPSSQWSLFLRTNVIFYNKREGKNIRTTELDIGQFRLWSLANTSLRPVLMRDVLSIYVADMRTQIGSTQSGVRLVNGQTLPPLGLTVASPNPVYVKGHYNAPNAAHLGTTNTSQTQPAAIIGDAIHVLSTAWNDASSGSGLSSRRAADTTVNAALLTGIVASNGSNYSGGVENVPRFLEDWSAKTFTYNGSLVVLFYSAKATAPWGGSDVYSPPIRNWSFNSNFLDPARLPPGTLLVGQLPGNDQE